MPAAPDPRRANRERVARHRAALRAAGLRPRQFWLPDPREPRTHAAIERAVAAVNRALAASDDIAFAEALANEVLEALPPWAPLEDAPGHSPG